MGGGGGKVGRCRGRVRFITQTTVMFDVAVHTSWVFAVGILLCIIMTILHLSIAADYSSYYWHKQQFASNAHSLSILDAQDNYPHMDYTALDLSPYYLYEARSNIKEWHRLRQPKLSMGGVDGSGAHFLQAAAEKIPQPDASHDVVRTHCTLHL